MTTLDYHSDGCDCESCLGALVIVNADKRLRTLSANLAVGGMLCTAFLDGWYQGMDYQRAKNREISTSDRIASMWRPGCGRSLLP